MKLIAIEASTEILSLAVSCDGVQRECEMPGAAHASANLLPALLVLMAELNVSWTQLDAVVWGRGPGSFTGLRTACAVAQGIGFAHNVPVLGVDTLAACAQHASHGLVHEGEWAVALDARMGEVYLARYAAGQWRQPGQGTFELLSPQDVVLQPGDVLCGNAVAAYPELARRASQSVVAMPTAAAMLELAPELLRQGLARPAEEALPLYVRNKVALTTAEREQIKRQA